MEIDHFLGLVIVDPATLVRESFQRYADKLYREAQGLELVLTPDPAIPGQGAKDTGQRP